MKDRTEGPPVVELAPLPRELRGPFLILGVEKDAGADEIEAGWRRHAGVPDADWARQILGEPTRRLRADVESLNIDTLGRVLRELERSHPPAGPTWEPTDVEAGAEDVTPLPSVEEVRAAPDLTAAAVPRDAPAAAELLRQFVGDLPDPWDERLASLFSRRQGLD